jgi:hypothetical protein
MRAVLSSDAVTMRDPSGLKAAECTGRSLPQRVNRQFACETAAASAAAANEALTGNARSTSVPRSASLSALLSSPRNSLVSESSPRRLACPAATLARASLAAHRDESVAHAHCEHAPLNGAFAVDLLVFDENLANGRRFAHNRNASERKSTGHGLRPAFKRVRPQCLQECERTERPCLRRRRGRSKTGIGERVHFQDSN